MTKKLGFAITLAAALVIASLPSFASAHDAPGVESGKDAADHEFEDEHIFGFAEGSDIGSKGEAEIESATVGSFGRLGNYNAVDNETSLRYGVADHFRLSIGTLTNFYSISGVPDLTDRHETTFSGLIGEARWNIFDRASSPFGMSLSFNPEWRQFDPDSGEKTASYALPLTLLIDKEIIPERFFATANFVFTPSFLRVHDARGHDDAITLIVAGAYALTPNLLAGAEIRHENLAENGTFGAHALYIGPSLYYRLTEQLSAKAAWAAQIPDFGSSRLDLTTYQRHQVELQFAYHF
jgi:hypothetical protein